MQICKVYFAKFILNDKKSNLRLLNVQFFYVAELSEILFFRQDVNKQLIDILYRFVNCKIVSINNQ